ncbi:MAG: phosphatidylserine synthase, partial [Mameliella sp.]|nr:phosphatidylserine synthase [Mameliella sp.]
WHEPLAPEAMSPETLYPPWQGEIRRNGLRRPENRSGFLVPFDAEEGTDLAQDLPGVTEDIV